MKRNKEVAIEPNSLETCDLGLSSQQVAERQAAGLVNGNNEVATKSFWKIFCTNTFTLFNILNAVLVLLVCILGKSPKNATFIGPAVINWIIGIVQEVRAKRTIDKLSLISAPRVTVIRDDEPCEIALEQIVMDDVMVLGAGNQICADCEVVDGGCEVNESLITGESDPIIKNVGDTLLSGSYIMAGHVQARVVHIGMDNYATKISAGAKYIKSNNSEILRALRTVIKLMSIVVVPLGVLLFLKQFLVNSVSLDVAIVNMVASMSGMIPQGLMALSSTVFAIGIIRLSKHNTLSQDLYCIETLARVDVLCLDKTGTITEGSMQLRNIVPIGDASPEYIDEALANLVYLLQDDNPTSFAIKERYRGWQPTRRALYAVPFSSARKWSGIATEEGSFVMGAAEFVLGERSAALADNIEYYSKEGYRVLVLVAGKQILTDAVLPEGLQPIAYVLISDRIRKEAPDTLRYFAEQNVDIRIISGDNPVTVSAIAREAGLGNCQYVDMSTITDDDALVEAARNYKVFGRVTPDQKLKLVKALKADGHTVAMTGDGVNDVLALKEADCSIAMAAGSDAARNVAQLVLLDSNFASMPRIVAEGRRSINNLQRSAALYLVKTMYMALLTMLFVFVGTYPFEPSNITLVGAATIGIPSFFLALERNRERVKGHFLQNALSKSLPGAISIFIAFGLLQVLFAVLPDRFDLTVEQLRTVSVLVLSAGAFLELFYVCYPYNWKHIMLVVSMLGVFFLGWASCSVNLSVAGRHLDLIKMNLFSMVPIKEVTGYMWVFVGSCVGFMLLLFSVLVFLTARYNLLSAKRVMKALHLEDKA